MEWQCRFFSWTRVAFSFVLVFFFEAPLFTVHRIGRLATGLGSSDAKRLSRPSSHLSDRRHALLFSHSDSSATRVSLCREREREREDGKGRASLSLFFFFMHAEDTQWAYYCTTRTEVGLGLAWLCPLLLFCGGFVLRAPLPATHTYIPFSLSASGQYRPSFCPFYPSSYLAPRA